MDIIDNIGVEYQPAPTEEEIANYELISLTGDKDASVQLMIYHLANEGKLNKKAIKYMLLAIEQGHNFLANIIGEMYLKGLNEGVFKVSASPKKAFRFFLWSNSFSAFQNLKEIANDDDKMWNMIIQSAKNNRLHPVYNDLINTLSESIPNDISKIKIYTNIVDRVINFFVEERRKMVVESNIGEKKTSTLTHYTDINALHSMLRLPEDAEKIIQYKDKYPVLRLYNVAYMNDPEEGAYLYDKDTFRELVPYLGEDNYYYTYLTSFTTGDTDDLTMWRLYGRDGKGISITIPTDSLFSPISTFEMCCTNLQSFISGELLNETKRNEENVCLYGVKYDCDELRGRITELLEKLKTEIRDNGDAENKVLIDALMRSFVKASDEVRFLYKNKQYSVECEYRLLSFHTLESSKLNIDERDIPRLYINTKPIFSKGTVITIGPKVENKVSVKLELEYRLKKYGFDGVSVVISKAKYK